MTRPDTETTSEGRLAIIAGRGALPGLLVAALPGPAPLVAALDGFAPDGLTPDITFRVERLALFLRHLEDCGVTRVVFAGAVQRPRLDPALFDPATAQMVPQLLAAMQGGDDATLRGVIAIFEEAGFAVLGLADLAPGLLADTGVLGARAPSAADLRDAARGRAILDALAPVDVGQGCVVAEGLCLGIETIYGTDALLAFVASHRADLAPARGGVFTKRAKQGQDLRTDLPAIGPATIASAAAAGLGGLCLQAGRVIVIDRAEVLARADAAGLALWAEP
ncbi:UDP-2,3-diacylglucosamine diphosphatase LpxI [Paracoccaceae bacterium Fryx2]|nr:UDP-2,3-diacylglucosamine diphosphatase LpxI [Paracoccaceae bacterium Fryx2]